MGTNRSDKVIAEVLGEEIAITPSELVSRQIKKQAMGGYDTDEVDDILEHTAEALEKLITRVRELKTLSEHQRTQIEEYREIEASLRNALVYSQKFGDDIVVNAKREAELILGEAKLKRSEAEAEAARLPEAITREIRLLMEERDRIREDILAVLDAHRSWVEERVPERDSALSERLLAFVNSRQGVPLDELKGDTNGEPADEAPVDKAENTPAGESPHEEEDDASLPDVVLGLEGEADADADADTNTGPEPAGEPATETGDDTIVAGTLADAAEDEEAGTMADATDDEEEPEVLEAVAEEDDEDTVKETTA